LAEQLGGVDILINNAGIGDFGSIEEMPSETWEQVIKTNLFGVYYAAKAVHPFMKAKGEGDIVNVASTAGLKGGPNMSAYAASKAAVVSLSQSMMAEWRKQNIRVITLRQVQLLLICLGGSLQTEIRIKCFSRKILQNG
jgi:3-oxoacyl-[acyl-carrier protein] reductase